MELTFWGATDTVTGSRFVVDTGAHRVLVDCGLFQGLKRLRRRNWDPFPVDPASIDAVVLTHAHIDHSGYLPALVRDGFAGPIVCTRGTADLATVLLPDSAHLQEEDARFANKHRSTRHAPALPLYTSDDAEVALRALTPAAFDTDREVVPGLTARFSPVGHIIGAASVRLDDGERSVTFSGDVGRPIDPVMRPPAPLQTADHVVVESTYGNRTHPATDPAGELASIIGRTLERGGTVLIPTFAVGRAQTILYLLSRLRADGRIPEVPTYLNSPMAISATELFLPHPEAHRLDPAACAALCDGVTFVRSVEESKQLTPLGGPMIVLSASGMMSGGRVLHHLMRVAPDRRSSIVVTGFQAAGTRGEALLAGARRLKIYGTYVDVRAEVHHIDSLSAHADADELIAWLRTGDRPPERVHIVHGEPSAADAMRRLVRDELGWSPHLPTHGESVTI